MPSFDVASRIDMAKDQASKKTAGRGLMIVAQTARQPNPH